MISDTGFAPNPYHGVLTLACCRPDIRRNASEKDWIMGVGRKAFECDKPKLIYLAKIKNKLRRATYWYDYPEKRFEAKVGNHCLADNIYEPDGQGGFKDPPIGARHSATEKEHDLGCTLESEWVLVCSRFFYFGRNAPFLPNGYKSGTRHFNISDREEISNIIKWARKEYRKLFGERGIAGHPHG
jgi:hypothetical protein